LEEEAIKNPYLRQSIDSSKQLIYGWGVSKKVYKI
jgi:hypothetical protein